MSAETRSAPRPVRDNALAVMRLLPRGARGAEVGTHDGRWTRALRDVAAPASLTLIDPWAEDEGRDARAHAYRAPQAARDAMHAAVRAEFSEAEILRRPSAEALAGMRDGALDWLFLDGEKQFDVLLADLEAAVRVVAPGGVVAGGGWHHGRELGWPVREAVREVAGRLGVEIAREGHFWALRLPATVRLAPRDARARYLVIAPMKNEAPYILEWIAHNRAIGFTDFLVLTNDCDDTTDPILQRLQEMGLATHVTNTVLKRGPHKSALKWARDHVARLRADWILIADVDEFIDLPGHGTIPAMLDALGPDTDVVSFPWKVFGNGGVEAFEDRPVTEQFVRCEPAPRRGGRRYRDVKTLFRRPEAMYHFGLHRPRVRDEWKDRIVWKSPAGEDISARMNRGSQWLMRWDGCEAAGYMHHYPLRSLEAYILKKNRGRANHVGEDLGRAYWDKWNLNAGRDAGLARGVPGFREELDRLMADRTLRRLHREGVAWHRAQFEALMREPRYRALWDELRAAGADEDTESGAAA
ncbi:glycosyltransferase family 2 protein [Jannaschia sp. W003]|uniref:glycosyltransferase family 2 protein n=1 Tax=Jannaschia sp. W003 TaxID=2867012 RepID=UPI0021A44E11|nr:glycosyltransferase family 2 protein [Jannaschia sp. W003]UWQ21778.1 glycosyltransferase family 2 protein [Jannaschia sp. W003]